MFLELPMPASHYHGPAQLPSCLSSMDYLGQTRSPRLHKDTGSCSRWGEGLSWHQVSLPDEPGTQVCPGPLPSDEQLSQCPAWEPPARESVHMQVHHREIKHNVRFLSCTGRF